MQMKFDDVLYDVIIEKKKNDKTYLYKGKRGSKNICNNK